MKDSLRIEVLVIKDSRGQDDIGKILLTPYYSQPWSEDFRRKIRILRQLSRNGGSIVKFLNERPLRSILEQMVTDITQTAESMDFDVKPVIWRETDMDIFNLVHGLAQDQYGIRRYGFYGDSQE